MEALKLLVGAGANVNVADKVRTRYYANAVLMCADGTRFWHRMAIHHCIRPLGRDMSLA